MTKEEKFTFAKQWYDSTTSQKEKLFLEELFPELRDFDDDMIRNEIIDYLKRFIPHNDPDLVRESKVCIAWLEKLAKKTNLYSGISFEYNGHFWGMCARDNGVDILLDRQFFKHLEKQDEHELVESMECSSKTTNVEFFQWIYDRLKYVYNESPNVDFMRSLKERIEGMKNPSCSEEDERIRKDIVAAVETYGDFTQDRKEEIYAWLKKQDECKLLNKKIRGKDELFDHRYAQYLVEAMHQPYMIQWKGDNLKEVIDFTGKSKNFDEWFPSFEEFERYVHEHNNIFKLFNEDGSHFEIPVGAWIVKTPDGYNVASKAIFKNKPSCSEEDDRIKSCIGMCLTDATEQRFKDFNTTLKDCLDWLEKHGEQKSVNWHFPYGKNETVDKLIAIAECLEMDGDCLFNGYTGIECGKFLRDLARKQAECKSIDEVKPKFKVGDWITTVNDNGGRVVENVVEFIGNKVRLVDTDGVYTICPQSWLNHYYFWTIQDAKDGDVLVSVNPFIFRGFGDKKHPNSPVAYCGIDTQNNFISTLRETRWTTHEVHPATKKEVDFLFQKMHEAGYEWDVEKKELMKIEQESTWNEKIKGLNELEAYILSLVPDRSLDAIKVDAKNIRYIINKEQKPAWSEEDEAMIRDIIDGLISQRDYIFRFDEQGKAQMNKRINWLYNLLKLIGTVPSKE